MKIQNTIALLVCLFCMLGVSAQEKPVPINTPNYNKPKVFTDVPDKQPLHLKDLQTLLDLAVGTKVNVTVTKNLVLNGVVVSKSNSLDKWVKSVVVKSNLRQGTTLTFTRITEAKGGYSYLGRVISQGAGDALEFTWEGDGYIVRKKGIYDVINE
jgi:hypothetical protein